MRRYRWWLIGVGVLGLAAAGLIVAAFLIERPPFRFLDGQKAVPMVRSEAEDMGIDPDRDPLYSFQGDFDEVVRRAKAELLPEGYTFMGQESPAEENLAILQRGPVIVRIEARTRVTEVSLRGLFAKGSLLDITPGPEGWVTVACSGLARSPSLWDRVRRLVGL